MNRHIHILILFIISLSVEAAFYEIPEGSKLVISKEENTKGFHLVELKGVLTLKGIMVMMKNYNYDDKIRVKFIPDKISSKLLPSGYLGLSVGLEDWYKKSIPNEIKYKFKNKKIFSISVPVEFNANKYVLLNQCSYISLFVAEITNFKIKGDFTKPNKVYKRNGCG